MIILYPGAVSIENNNNMKTTTKTDDSWLEKFGCILQKEIETWLYVIRNNGTLILSFKRWPVLEKLNLTQLL